MNMQIEASVDAGGHRVCPWWVAYFFDNPIRRLIHPAEKILGPYVTPGMTVLDLGCGFGHYAMGMARLTGAGGRVLAVDVQQKMLEKTMARARKAGLDKIIRPFQCCGRRIGVQTALDFALAGNVLHEAPDPGALLEELFSLLKPGSRFLLLEPAAHMKPAEFEVEVFKAKDAGFKETDGPKIFREFSVLFQKPEPRKHP